MNDDRRQRAKRPRDLTWTVAVAAPLAVFILCSGVLMVVVGIMRPADAGQTGALFATIGGVMGAIFTVGGLVIGLTSLVTLLTIDDRAKRAFDERFVAMRPALEKLTDARVQSHLLLRDAQRTLDAMFLDASRQPYEVVQHIDRARSAKQWAEAERLVSEALRLYPDLPGGRRMLGLRLRDLAVSRIKGGAHASRYWLNADGLGDLSSPAIHWLQDAAGHGEDGDRQVSVALAGMYGVARRYDTMLDTIKRAVADDPAMRPAFRSPDSLTLLAQACEAEADQERALRQLGDLLNLPLPAQQAEFFYSIVNRPDVHTGAYWLALARRDYWIRQPARPRSPLLVLLWVNDDQGKRLARAGYFLAPSSERTDLPSESGRYISDAELFAELNERFLLISQFGDNASPGM